MTDATEIQYGRIDIDGTRCGIAIYENEAGSEVELINVPNGGLYVKINGELRHTPGEVPTQYVMLWTKVAGWLGTQECLDGIQ